MTFTETELGLYAAIIAVGGIVVGGLIAGGFAIVTGVLESRREHKRWLREQRYAVFVNLVTCFNRIRHLSRAVPSTKGEAERLKVDSAAVYQEVLDTLPQLFILGPRRVSVSAARTATALNGVAHHLPGAEDDFTQKRAQLIRDVQDVLHAGWPWQRVTLDDAVTFKEITKERARRPKMNNS